MVDGWRLVRGSNLVIAAAGVLAGGWIALGLVAIPKLLAFAAGSAVGLGAAGNVWNDLQDREADRVNHPSGDRLLATGRVTPDFAHLLVWLGVLLGIGAAALVSGRQLCVGLAALVLMATYSPWLKRWGLPGNLVVAVLAGLPLFYGALALGRPEAGLVPWALAAWIHLARELVKDLQDEAGDRAAGRRTLPIRLGKRQAGRMAAGFCLGFAPLAVVLPLAAGYRWIYFAVAAAAVLCVGFAVRELGRDRFSRASGLLKVGMVIGLVALVAGRVT